MKTIVLTGVAIKPNEGVEVELKDGYEKYLVFYPANLYLNIQFLDAELVGKSMHCRNTDEQFTHELWIIQFNHPLPPIFKVEPWQILVEGKR